MLLQKVAYPYNEYSIIYAYLIDKGKISFGDSLKISQKFKNLMFYNFSPRKLNNYWKNKIATDFGFSYPNKEKDPRNYNQYSLFYNNIRITVRVARALSESKKYFRLLQYNSKKSFWLNFAQLKPASTDIFIFIGIWIDKTKVWVMDKDDVQNSRFYVHQHRGSINYQIPITNLNIDKFEQFSVPYGKIKDAVVNKGGAIKVTIR